MTLTVHLFARARELAAADTVTLDVPTAATIGDLRRALAERVPALASLLPVSMIAVNHEFAPDALLLASEAELAVIPPVSGG